MVAWLVAWLRGCVVAWLRGCVLEFWSLFEQEVGEAARRLSYDMRNRCCDGKVASRPPPHSAGELGKVRHSLSGMDRPLRGLSIQRSTMEFTFKKKLLAYLSGAALSLTAGTATARLELDAIPESVIEDLLDDLEKERWRAPDMSCLMNLLATDSRRQVKSRVLEFFAAPIIQRPLDNTEQVFRCLAEDNDRVVRRAAAEAISRWLATEGGLNRLRFTSEWSLSDEPRLREAIARSLAGPVTIVGVDLLLEHLAKDPVHAVRCATARAAESRFEENPAAYENVLRRLASDSDRRVRKSARRAVTRRMC
ncbi:MAG: hypothetical protein A2289_18450 [Deltaproteobacteria bacterium RIFOXYA12_FULL_58_15]|nr:MAG: hypothetical protein A2289_18450 [Deltaproteobacteria bacterium RIFOXYA12_FULL_58_15]OGR10591.1 MAG: hypothetical protein A2341_09580 [Deltaproteobacteria bacterium RIFOXYB12_FULL_58_9]